MTASMYTKILEQHMLPTTAWLLPHLYADFILQQDNDRKHMSRRAFFFYFFLYYTGRLQKEMTASYSERHVAKESGRPLS